MEFMTVREGAKIIGVDQNTLYQAIRKGRMKSRKGKDNKNHKITREDLADYIASKYNRIYFSYKGKPKFDKKKGEYSIREAAEYLGVTDHFLYNLARTKQIDHIRKGSTYVLFKSDLEGLKKKLLEK